MLAARAIGTTLASCALVTALVGCNAGSEATDDPAPPATTAADASVPEPGASADPLPAGLDPAHAVDRPGRRSGQIAFSDVIANASDTLDPATVRAIQSVRGVQDVEQIALVDVLIENQAVTVAAVDPATYRNYTEIASAQQNVVWDRVADGEIALRPGLAKKLPIDTDDFLALGSTDDAPRVHVGAFAALSPQIDAVVNESWIEDLDMVPDNGLLIRTGSTAPDTVRSPIEKLLQATPSSVQMTDSVARFGFDPDVKQTAVVVGTIGDAVGTYRYTVLGGGQIAPDPSWVATHIATRTVPILGSVTCNKAIFPQLIAALNDVISRGLADKIHPGEYAGCYNARFIAGSTSLSNHAFGLALDLNVPGNGRGTVGEMDRGVVDAFKSWGFDWGGDWNYTDPMHFEMNRLVTPR